MASNIGGHIGKCFVAGIVALLPIGATLLLVAYLENSIASSGLIPSKIYFPGLGLIAAAAIIYAIGLFVTTFVGRWLWTKFDRLLSRIPTLGRLYDTLKQILGYGEGKDALFIYAVLVHGPGDLAELGLVTSEQTSAAGQPKLLVFVPGSPSPATGRLLIVDPARVQRLPMKVSDVFKTLVSLGKTPVMERAVELE